MRACVRTHAQAVTIGMLASRNQWHPVLRVAAAATGRFTSAHDDRCPPLPACPPPARAGNLLLGAAGVALSLSTCLACVWPQGVLDHVMVEGLARKGGDNYTLWPLWVWIFCVFW